MGWGDKLNQITKSAVSKSKEVAEITRLNMEISSNEQKIKELAAQIGMIVAEQQLLPENEEIAGAADKIRSLLTPEGRTAAVKFLALAAAVRSADNINSAVDKLPELVLRYGSELHLSDIRRWRDGTPINVVNGVGKKKA